MTAQERLIIYTKALKDYKRANSWFWKIFGNSKIYTEKGFCTYFFLRNNTILRGDLIELKTQEPKEFYFDGFVIGYWFKPGELEPRIKCLEKAIEECKLNILKEKQ